MWQRVLSLLSIRACFAKRSAACWASEGVYSGRTARNATSDAGPHMYFSADVKFVWSSFFWSVIPVRSADVPRRSSSISPPVLCTQRNTPPSAAGEVSAPKKPFMQLPARPRPQPIHITRKTDQIKPSPPAKEAAAAARANRRAAAAAAEDASPARAAAPAVQAVAVARPQLC